MTSSLLVMTSSHYAVRSLLLAMASSNYAMTSSNYAMTSSLLAVTSSILAATSSHYAMALTVDPLCRMRVRRRRRRDLLPVTRACDGLPPRAHSRSTHVTGSSAAPPTAPTCARTRGKRREKRNQSMCNVKRKVYYSFSSQILVL